MIHAFAPYLALPPRGRGQHYITYGVCMGAKGPEEREKRLKRETNICMHPRFHGEIFGFLFLVCGFESRAHRPQQLSFLQNSGDMDFSVPCPRNSRKSGNPYLFDVPTFDSGLGTGYHSCNLCNSRLCSSPCSLCLGSETLHGLTIGSWSLVPGLLFLVCCFWSLIFYLSLGEFHALCG